MAMIALRVPFETARLLGSIAGALPGDAQAASELHVTVLYLGDGVPMEQLARAMVACHAVTAKTPPFMLTVSEVSSFDPGKNGTPVIMPVQSQELMALEQSLKSELDKAEVPYSKKYDVYRPHITLTYISGKQAEGEISLPVSWGAFELEIYGANRGNGRVQVILPFELSNTQIRIKNIASRIAGLPFVRTRSI